MTIYKKMSHGKTHLYGRTEAGEEYIGPEDDPTKWDRKITTKILEKENKKIQDSISRYLDDVQLLTLYMPEPERKEYLSKRSAELLARLRRLEPLPEITTEDIVKISHNTLSKAAAASPTSRRQFDDRLKKIKKKKVGKGEETDE